MRRVRFTGLLWTAWLALAFAASAEAQPPPRLEFSGGVLELTRLPPILDDVEVSDHLRSGLTTTLALRLELRGTLGKQEGGALVTVRFDLWDEVFHVAQIGAAGLAERRSFDSSEALEAWWRELRLAVLKVPDRGPPGWTDARLSIDVVPFSAAEARETQRWFSETLDDAKQSSTEGSSTGEDGDTLGRAFRLMMATSIQRRPLHVYRYVPEIAQVGAPR